MNIRPVTRVLGTLTLLHWCVVALSLTLTFVAWHISSRIAEEKALEQFEHQVDQITEQLKDRMANYAFALISGVGAIQTQEGGLSRSQWADFSRSLALPEKLPGINGIGVIFRVPPADLESFIEDQRKIRPDFRVHPPHDTDDYWPITYIVPEASNKAAIGLDMAHESNRYTAARKAMQTGETQITGPIVLVQDSTKTPGFLFYQPFYQTIDTPPGPERERQFKGLVYAPFVMRRLMEGALANENRRVQLRISDQGQILYDELSAPEGNYDANPLFDVSMTVPMYGREWRFDLQTTELFRTFNASKQPAIILVTGLLIDGFILFVFILLTRARERAELRANDMTRHYDNEARKLEAVLNTVSEAIITTDKQGFITSLNPAANRLFGATRIGEPIVALFDDAFHDLIAQYAANSSQGHSTSFETVAFDRNNDSFPAHVGRQTAQMDTGVIYTYTVRDLSIEKSADLAKSQFVSTVSHELRTPLTAISGAVALLENQLGASLERNGRRMTDIIRRNAERLNLLVSDLLDLEGFSGGNIRLDKKICNLSRIAEKAISDCAPYADKYNVKLTFTDLTEEATILADQDRIGQVMLNLISNAVKFSEQGSSVQLEMVSRAPDQVCIRVVDQGAGIPDHYRKHAFSRFSQADSSDARQKSGTGLGLSICKAIIDMHNGVIDYESELGVGSTFYFCLALARETAPPDAVS